MPASHNENAPTRFLERREVHRGVKFGRDSRSHPANLSLVEMKGVKWMTKRPQLGRPQGSAAAPDNRIRPKRWKKGMTREEYIAMLNEETRALKAQWRAEGIKLLDD